MGRKGMKKKYRIIQKDRYYYPQYKFIWWHYFREEKYCLSTNWVQTVSFKNNEDAIKFINKKKKKLSNFEWCMKHDKLYRGTYNNCEIIDI